MVITVVTKIIIIESIGYMLCSIVSSFFKKKKETEA